MVKIFQQYLYHTKEAPNPVASPSMRQRVSAVSVCFERPRGILPSYWPSVHIKSPEKLVQISVIESAVAATGKVNSAASGKFNCRYTNSSLPVLFLIWAMTLFTMKTLLTFLYDI